SLDWVGSVGPDGTAHVLLLPRRVSTLPRLRHAPPFVMGSREGGRVKMWVPCRPREWRPGAAEERGPSAAPRAPPRSAFGAGAAGVRRSHRSSSNPVALR